MFGKITSDKKLKDLLHNSSATEEFKRAVLDFTEGKKSDLIRYNFGSPKVKVLRVLQKLLEEFSHEPIASVHIEGDSSCSSYSGILTFEPNQARVSFNWDCYWKAEQEGMKTWYGEPDQSKAAQKFGYQCFQQFERID